MTCKHHCWVCGYPVDNQAVPCPECGEFGRNIHLASIPLSEQRRSAIGTRYSLRLLTIWIVLNLFFVVFLATYSELTTSLYSKAIVVMTLLLLSLLPPGALWCARRGNFLRPATARVSLILLMINLCAVLVIAMAIWFVSAIDPTGLFTPRPIGRKAFVSPADLPYALSLIVLIGCSALAVGYALLQVSGYFRLFGTEQSCRALRAIFWALSGLVGGWFVFVPYQYHASRSGRSAHEVGAILVVLGLLCMLCYVVRGLWVLSKHTLSNKVDIR